VNLGVFGLNARSAHGPEQTLQLARRAEALGYTSWWAGEHVVLPSPRTGDSPMEPTDPVPDPLVHLAYVAAATRRIELGAGVIVLPQGDPVVFAKRAASLDMLSAGRLLLGVGAGFQPELSAIGAEMSSRGRRTDEYLDAMTALWEQKAPPCQGRYVAFNGVDAHPRPVRCGPRIVIGGHSRAAFRRAVARGHGWYGIGTQYDLITRLSGLRRTAAEVDRPARLGRLEIFYQQLNPATVDADAARLYADLGVDQLVLCPQPLEDPAEVTRFLELHADLPR
jgi:probable F420-dependent oxidoreductase